MPSFYHAILSSELFNFRCLGGGVIDHFHSFGGSYYFTLPVEHLLCFSERPSSRRGRNVFFAACLLLPRDFIICNGSVIAIRKKLNMEMKVQKYINLKASWFEKKQEQTLNSLLIGFYCHYFLC